MKMIENTQKFGEAIQHVGEFLVEATGQKSLSFKTEGEIGMKSFKIKQILGTGGLTFETKFNSGHTLLLGCTNGSTVISFADNLFQIDLPRDFMAKDPDNLVGGGANLVHEVLDTLVQNGLGMNLRPVEVWDRLPQKFLEMVVDQGITIGYGTEGTRANFFIDEQKIGTDSEVQVPNLGTQKVKSFDPENKTYVFEIDEKERTSSASHVHRMNIPDQSMVYFQEITTHQEEGPEGPDIDMEDEETRDLIGKMIMAGHRPQVQSGEITRTTYLDKGKVVSSKYDSELGAVVYTLDIDTKEFKGQKEIVHSDILGVLRWGGPAQKKPKKKVVL